MDTIFTKTEKIPASACDKAGAVPLPYLLQLMERLALADAKRIGQGRELLVERYDACWMILTNDITLQRPIFAGETVQLQTWCRGVRGATVGRDYLFTVAGQEVLRCTQAWVVVNLATRTLCNPRKMPELRVECPACALEALPRSAPPIAPLTKAASMTVTAQDLDRNGHMNNACYVAHALPLIPEAYLKNGFRAELCYRFELLEGTTYDCFTGCDEAGCKVAFRVDGRDSFTMQISEL